MHACGSMVVTPAPISLLPLCALKEAETLIHLTCDFRSPTKTVQERSFTGQVAVCFLGTPLRQDVHA